MDGRFCIFGPLCEGAPAKRVGERAFSKCQFWGWDKVLSLCPFGATAPPLAQAPPPPYRGSLSRRGRLLLSYVYSSVIGFSAPAEVSESPLDGSVSGSLGAGSGLGGVVGGAGFVGSVGSVGWVGSDVGGLGVSGFSLGGFGLSVGGLGASCSTVLHLPHTTRPLCSVTGWCPSAGLPSWVVV